MRVQQVRGIAVGIGLCGVLTVLTAASAAADTSPFVGPLAVEPGGIDGCRRASRRRPT